MEKPRTSENCFGDKIFEHKRITSNDTTIIQISDGAMLQRVAEELAADIPFSFQVLGALRCHQHGEIPYNFYVDQFPSLNACVAVIKPEYFYKRKTPPYTIVQFYERGNDAAAIEKMLMNVNIDWHLPVQVFPGPNKHQTEIIHKMFEKHGTVKYDDHFFNMAYTSKKSDVKLTAMPENYEYVELKPESLKIIANNWRYAYDPFVLDDIETLMERFSFRGIRCKSDGALVAHCGQLHGGCAGIGWVHPEHRGKKLFQALISRFFHELIDRYGFTYGNVIDGNSASWAANKNVGLQSTDGHEIYWIIMVPFAEGKSSEKNGA